MKSYELIKHIKTNVCLVKDLKDEQLIVKSYPKNEQEYSIICLHELNVLQKLQHQNIVKIEKIEEDKHNYFLIFKYIQGDIFSEKFKNLNHDNDKYGFLKVINKILEALNYIHVHNYIHKDIKSSNILVNYNNEPYILDFGTSTISNTITKSINQLSLWYASPEQKNNLPTDVTTDFYSFGITIIETLVESKIFRNFIENKISIEDAIDTIRLFSDGRNEEFRNILKRMTYKTKKQRYQNAKEIITEINHLLSFLILKINMN